MGSLRSQKCQILPFLADSTAHILGFDCKNGQNWQFCEVRDGESGRFVPPPSWWRGVSLRSRVCLWTERFCEAASVFARNISARGVAAMVLGIIGIVLNVLLIVLQLTGVLAGLEAWLYEWLGMSESGETMYPIGDGFWSQLY